MRKMFCICFCFIWFGCLAAHADVPLVRLNADRMVLISAHQDLWIKEKPSKKWQIANAKSKDGLGFFDGRFRGEFIVVGCSASRNWMLDISFPFHNRLELSIEQGGKKRVVMNSGDHFSFSMRLIRHPNFLYAFEASEEDTIKFIWEVDCDGEYSSPRASIYSSKQFLEKNTDLNLAFGLYYGVLLFAFFLTLFLLVIAKELTQVYYLFYLFGIGLFQFSLDGFSFMYFWPDQVFWANRVIPFSGSFGAGFLLLFARGQLGFTQKTSLLGNSMFFMGAVLFLASVLALIPNTVSYQFSLYAANGFALLANFLVLVAAIKAYRSGQPSAGYFLMGFGLLILGIILAMLRNFGLIPNNPLSEYGMQLGSAIEVVFITVGLANNIRLLRGQKEEAQRQLIVELQDKNKRQERYKMELEREVEERTAEIKRQKEKLQHINKDITDSIRYASRIQKIMGGSGSDLQIVFPDSFFWTQPRDIVNGDFFWIACKDDEVYLAVADCTGHGVPGALMSMIGVTYLNEIISSRHTIATAEILNSLRDRIIRLLKQKENSSRDGMDISLVRIHLKTLVLEFSGAFNPLLVLSDSNRFCDFPEARRAECGEFFLLVSADRFPVGEFGQNQESLFTSKALQLERGDKLFLFSDGFSDQFGGANGKKYRTARFYDFLCSLKQAPMQEQAGFLSNEFEFWKGEEPQVDDVTVLGIRII